MSLGIQYQFSAIDDLTKVVNKISGGMDKMDGKIDAIGRASEKAGRKSKKAFAGMGRAAAGLGRKLRGLAIAAVAFVGIKSIFSKGMEFEDAIAGVAAITGAGAADMKIFTDESIRMSKKFGVSAASIANSFLDIGSAKSELLTAPMELSRIVDQTVLLAKAGGVTVDISTDAMTKSLNIFKKGADSAEHFSDIMIQGTVVGAAKLDEFSQSILNAGGSAAATGLNFADTTALIQLLSKGGEVGARAGTALNSFLARMSKEFKDVDVSTGEKMIEFLDKLDVANKAGKLNISEAFGEEAARAVRILLKQKEFLPIFLKDIRAAGGATVKAADIRMATTSQRLAKVRARLDIAMLRTFEKLEPIMTKMTEKFINWIDSLDSGDLQAIDTVLNGIATGLGLLGKAIKFIVDLLSKIGKAMGEVTAAFVTGDFSGIDRPSFAGAQAPSMWDMILNPTQSVFGMAGDMLSGDSKETIEVNVNLNDPGNAVASVQTKSSGLGGAGRKIKSKTNLDN